MHQSTLAELSSALESKKISSEELTRVYIERCKKHNVSLNCFITITEDEAIKKEYAQYFITKLIKEWREDKTSIPKDFIQSGFDKAKNDHEICIGVYE